MIIDGRTIAKNILARTKMRAEKLSHPPHVRAIVVSETLATLSYLKIKGMRAVDAGCMLEVVRFPLNVSTNELRSAASESVEDALIVQLPLPAAINTKEVCDAIPLSKDADVLSSVAREKFERAEADALLPPVVGAVSEIFSLHNINPKGKKTVVVGNGWLVGNPCALWLKQQGALVSVLTSESENMREALADAEIVISGAGAPSLIKPDYLKLGAVLIDAATSESNGIIAGDADPACAQICSLFTPVPGGIGPLAVAVLFENVVTLAERAMNT